MAAPIGAADRRRSLFVQGMLGLGDNIMQRPFVRAAAAREARVYLATPWPQLYQDLPNVFPVRTSTRLRTQAKSERGWAGGWHPKPGGGRSVRIAYGRMTGESIQHEMEQSLPLQGAPFVWDLPPLARPPVIDTGGRPIAVVRPVTEREEWLNSARNPKPQYIAEIAEALMETHFVVCVADLAPRAEWLVGPMPVCDLAFMHGELSSMAVLELIRKADLVVGGVGFLVPAALALRTPAFIVLGGQGAQNGPGRVVDARADASRLGWALPRSLCGCADRGHMCDKTIDGVLEQFGAWRRSLGVSDANAIAARQTGQASAQLD